MRLETKIFTTNFRRKDLKEQGETTYQVKNNGEEKPDVLLPWSQNFWITKIVSLSNDDGAARTVKKQ